MLGVQWRRETQGVGSWGRSLTAQHVILEVGWVMGLTICLNTLPSFSQQDIFKKGIWPTILMKTFRDADETRNSLVMIFSENISYLKLFFSNCKILKHIFLRITLFQRKFFSMLTVCES